jgi:hypothetical protein
MQLKTITGAREGIDKNQNSRNPKNDKQNHHKKLKMVSGSSRPLNKL